MRRVSQAGPDLTFEDDSKCVLGFPDVINNSTIEGKFKAKHHCEEIIERIYCNGRQIDKLLAIEPEAR